MKRREFLQLADKYNPDKHKIAGWYVSEKLDGTRCFWDGGITRGVPTHKVPWASVTDPKTGDKKKKIKPVSTGLWSRYGNPIVAPGGFLNQLPCCPLDGELWAGRGNFQLCRSICGGDEPDERFHQIFFCVYSTPSFPSVFGDGEIKNANFHRAISVGEIETFVKERMGEFHGHFTFLEGHPTFEQELLFMRDMLGAQEHVYMLQQTKLPGDEPAARMALEEHLNKLLALGAEGLVLRDPAATWTPKRHKGVLKYKPFLDDEGVISGFTSGRETTKGSRLLGSIGALILNYHGQRLELAGLTDDERKFHHSDAIAWAKDNPGEDMPERFNRSKYFLVGDKVTFKYRELSDDGIPKEARYFRKRDEE